VSGAHLVWQASTRRPVTPLPAGACDTAVHLFDPAEAARLVPGRRYEPPAATLADLQALQARLGLQRAVLVQPSVYGSDPAVLLAALRADPQHLRGVVVPNSAWSDAAWQDLHDAGVRGLRFNLLSRWGQPADRAELERHARRAEALGWSVSLHAPAAELAAQADWLLGLRCPVVVDHLAYLRPDELHGPAAAFLRHALGLGHWWLKVSRVDHRFAPPYDAAVALMQQVVAWAPNRMLWALDWPHPLYDAATCTLADDAELVDLFARVVVDPAMRRRILVDHPAQVFDFDPDTLHSSVTMP
jgi:predicted TIM-barrel fold metal-dependent hydrolase